MLKTKLSPPLDISAISRNESAERVESDCLWGLGVVGLERQRAAIFVVNFVKLLDS